jgi:hypothetical protein
MNKATSQRSPESTTGRAPADLPQPLLLDMAVLAAHRERSASPDWRWRPAVDRLAREADALLDLTPPSVMDKSTLPASGDRHDFFSMGPYWWPDPTKPDGLPYIRRDGEQNPQSRTGTDYSPFATLCAAVETLGLAGWYTRKAVYAEKIATLVGTWFLDPATRMNPHLEFAQAIPGITNGRDIGIIDFHLLVKLLDGLSLAAITDAWSHDQQATLTSWLESLLDWLLTSKNGRGERKQHNNHGTYYDLLVSYLALYVGRPEQATDVLREGLTTRLEAHVSPDGSQPHELARTRSWDYSLMNLGGLIALAKLGAKVGVDGWRHTGPQGQSLHGAIAFMAAYLDPTKPWLTPQIRPFYRSEVSPLVVLGWQQYGDADLEALFRRFGQPALSNDARWPLTVASF